MKNVNISTRLVGTFAIVLSLMLMLLLLSIAKINSLQSNLDQVVNENEVRVRLASDMLMSVQNVSRLVRDIALQQDMGAAQAEFKELKAERASYDENSKKLAEHIVTPEGRALFEKINTARDQTRTNNDVAIELAIAGRKQEAAELLLGRTVTQAAQWRELLKEFQLLQEDRNTKRVEAASKETKLAKLEMYLIGAAAVIASMALAAWIIRSITQPLQFAIKVTQRVAEGNLATEIESDRDDELGQLLKALTNMQQQLTEVVTTVRAGAEAVASESSEIAAGNIDLAARTEGQASALEQTSAAMEEVNAAVQRNAVNASEANDVAKQASAVAYKGGEVVGEVVETMKTINESSRKISDIVSLIDSIAFQTNILALNAAVEAARAGEHGKGFAVVATEVRSLAGRSADAAKEIKTLINSSVERVEIGAELVDRAGKTMQEVVSNIDLVNTYMERISKESAEQSLAVSQVKEAITQLDDVTQKNATLVQGMSGAANGLNAQAHDLVKSVSVFKIKQYVQTDAAYLLT